jgi:hypothetical protein
MLQTMTREGKPAIRLLKSCIRCTAISNDKFQSIKALAAKGADRSNVLFELNVCIAHRVTLGSLETRTG